MEIYFTKSHEWVKVEDGAATLGITGYAVEQLGDITYIELPSVGAKFGSGDVLCIVESVKAASDIYTPVSCSVKEVNSALENAPEKINSSPEGDGWIAKLELSSPGELSSLMNREKYLEYVKTL